MLYRRNQVWHYDFFVAGRRYRGTTKQANERKAQKIEAMLVAQAIQQGSTLPRRPPTLSRFSERFLKWVEESRLCAGSKRYYRDGWALLKLQRVAGMTLTDIGNDDAQVMQIPGSPSHFNKAVRTLRRMLHKAEEWKVIARAPRVAELEETGRDQLITPERETALLKHAPQPLRDVLLTIQDTGMRPSEIFRMRAEEILWNQSAILVPFGKRGNKSRRWVPLSQRVSDALMVRLRGRTEGWVFPSKRAKSGHIETVNQQWVEARKKAGLPQSVVLYSGRHTFGTEVYSKTGNLKVTMEVMGHHQVKTAMRYQHPEVDQVRNIIDRRNHSAMPDAAMSQTTSQPGNGAGGEIRPN
ncbi:MAG TPA: site-specific integrase [Terriglobales bacterium]|nr:site-specific integrase [Terriglobales bacterium]